MGARLMKMNMRTIMCAAVALTLLATTSAAFDSEGSAYAAAPTEEFSTTTELVEGLPAVQEDELLQFRRSRKTMVKKFKAIKPKMKKYCEVETKMLSHKSMCRSYQRFCNLYKKFGLIRAAKRHCDKMKAMHNKMVSARQYNKLTKKKGYEKKKAAKKKALAKKFKKLKPKMIKYCEVKTKDTAALGRCRGYARFCKLYKSFGLHRSAKRHCDKMKKLHHKMVAANKAARKAKLEKSNAWQSKKKAKAMIKARKERRKKWIEKNPKKWAAEKKAAKAKRKAFKKARKAKAAAKAAAAKKHAACMKNKKCRKAWKKKHAKELQGERSRIKKHQACMKNPKCAKKYAAKQAKKKAASLAACMKDKRCKKKYLARKKKMADATSDESSLATRRASLAKKFAASEKTKAACKKNPRCLKKMQAKAKKARALRAKQIACQKDEACRTAYIKKFKIHAAWVRSKQGKKHLAKL